MLTVIMLNAHKRNCIILVYVCYCDITILLWCSVKCVKIFSCNIIKYVGENAAMKQIYF